MSKTKDTAADEKATEMDVDPVQAKYEAEALAEQAKLDKAAKKAEGKAAETYETVEEVMPQRFFTGGATADEKAAWIEAHGGPKVEGVVEPGQAEPKAEGHVPHQ
jgi:hypothetical protein